MQMQHCTIEKIFELELIVPNVDHELLKLDSNPFWAKIWHSAIALSEFVENNNHLFKQKNIVEIGAGLGFPSLVVAKYANQVTCTDMSKAAVHLINLNIEKNKIVNINTQLYDWTQLFEFKNIDIVLLSDVNYAPDQFVYLNQLFFTLKQNGIKIFLASPQRLIAKPFIQLIQYLIVAQTEIEVNYANENKFITIFEM